jgi:hypothetical protein
MGGPGSGRRRQTTTVEECRVLDCDQLLGGGAARRAPRGEIAWTMGAELCGLLAYSVVEHYAFADLALLYHHWYGGRGLSCDQIRLQREPSGRYLASCPGYQCGGRPARKLYAPRGESHFLCRGCHKLVHDGKVRKDERALLYIVAKISAQLDAELRDAQGLPPLSGQAPPLPDPDRCRGLLDQELILACLLRLQRAGLSVRAIATYVERSKSSAQRLLAAGPGALDRRELFAQRRLTREPFASGFVPISLLRARETRVLFRDQDGAPPGTITCVDEIQPFWNQLRIRGEVRILVEQRKAREAQDERNRKRAQARPSPSGH